MAPVDLDVSKALAAGARFEVERVLTSADAPALLPFTVRSSAGEVLEVSLSSSLGDQVVFQLHNENLHSDASLEDDPADEFQLYNEVDLVDRVQLQPFEARELVLCFRPRPGGEIAPTETRQKQKRLADELEAAEADEDFRTPRHHHSVTDLSGTVFLGVQPTGPPASPKQGGGGGADRRLEVPFTARLCRSVLKTDAQARPSPPSPPPARPPLPRRRTLHTPRPITGRSSSSRTAWCTSRRSKTLPSGTARRCRSASACARSSGSGA